MDRCGVGTAAAGRLAEQSAPQRARELVPSDCLANRNRGSRWRGVGRQHRRVRGRGRLQGFALGEPRWCRRQGRVRLRPCRRQRGRTHALVDRRCHRVAAEWRRRPEHERRVVARRIGSTRDCIRRISAADVKALLVVARQRPNRRKLSEHFRSAQRRLKGRGCRRLARRRERRAGGVLEHCGLGARAGRAL